METSVDRPPIARYQFGLRDILIAVTVIGVLFMLLLPTIEASRESARRNTCVSNTKKLGLALHDYHKIYQQFPNISTKQIAGVAPASIGSTAPSAAGYSWQVAILPYIGELALFDELFENSKELEQGPFDPAVKRAPKSNAPSAANFPACVLPRFQCPSYSGSRFSDAPEYVQAAGVNGVAVSNYMALAATHLDCILGDPQAAGYLPANGVLVPASTVVTLADVTDGTAKTLMLCETRESAYTSWIDGTVGWGVGADCNQPSPAIDNNGTLRTDYDIALNVGPKANRQTSYLPARLHKSIAADWRWGPSSQHSGNTIIHGFADGSARGITADIDPTLYLQLITREGHEPVTSGCE